MSGRSISNSDSISKNRPKWGSTPSNKNKSIGKSVPNTLKSSTPLSNGRPAPSSMNAIGMSAIKPPNMNAKVVLDGNNRSNRLDSLDAQTVELLGERFVAHNEYLLAVAANKIKDRQKSDLENSIQSQLDTISKRLMVDQQTLSSLEKRLVDVKFLSVTSEKRSKQEAEFSARLKDMEKATGCVENIAAAVEPNLHYLRTKNVDLGPSISSFKDAMSATVKLLDGMNTESTDVINLAETAENLSSVNKNCKELDEQIDQLHELIPVCEDKVIKAEALKM